MPDQVRHDTLEKALEENTQKIRVCFVSPKAYPLFNPAVETIFGGAEVDSYLTATELAKDPRYEVSFVVADYGQENEEGRENIRLLKSLSFQELSLIGARKVWASLKKANADWYVIKTASPGVPLLQFFCRLHHRKFLYKTASQTECDGRYVQSHPLFGKIFLHSLRRATQVIVQNQEDRDNLMTRFSIPSEIIPNGHRIPECINPDKETILWVGRSANVKGPKRFLELANAFPKESFVMICPKATGDDNYDGLCDEANQIENLTFLRHVPFHAVDSYFEHAKIFVNTSDSEGFPNTFIQACKAGTAILSYAVNPDGFLDACQCGICSGSREQALQEKLNDLLRDDSFHVLGQNGLQYVKGRHNLQLIIEQYKRIFSSKMNSL